MKFTQSINHCFKHYSNFNGRARRSEFWWFELFLLIVTLVALFFDYGFDFYLDNAREWGVFDTFSTIILFLPALAVGARRLHDIGRSGWWQLLYLTVIGIILLIVWWTTDGTKKNNKFGKPIKLKK